MKDEILRENLRGLIKHYGFDATYNLCLQLEMEQNNLPKFIPILLSLTTQFYHRSRWIFDAQTGETIDTWAGLLKKKNTENQRELLNLLGALKNGKVQILRS